VCLSSASFIDTADSYGPDVSEELIREALYPYDGILIAAKAGFRRPGLACGRRTAIQSIFAPAGNQELPQAWVEQIGLWQLHRIVRKVPREAQFAAVKPLLDDGLSEVSVADIKAASQVFSVQNRYNLVDRGSEEVLEYCEQHGIGFIPWFPLAADELAKSGSILDRIAKAHGAAPSQIALACVLRRSPVMLPIPGTSKVKHLEENVAAVDIQTDRRGICCARPRRPRRILRGLMRLTA
jgi:pyridoxine 4-dehydrogenase